MKLLRFLCIIVALCTNACKGVAQSPIVQTAYGQVQGYSHEGLHIFKGIPFAKPPVGALRWKAPEPPAQWGGVKQCTSFSASPYQPTPAPFYCWTEEFIAPPAPLSEDCLYLNVWTSETGATIRKPVLVWIYGGGFSSGSAACAIYDGEEIAKEDIVFVSINYRVGPFGFMAHPELSREQDGASGNYGILDQVAALKWVQQNISAFGGDPARVSIAGQSAGSMSVNALVASPLARGLFGGAILQSGSLFSRMLSPLHIAEQSGLALEKATGVAGIDEMRGLGAEQVLKAAQSLQGMRFAPALDNRVLPAKAEAWFASGSHNDVPLLMGWVTGDATLLGHADITAQRFRLQAAERYGQQADDFLKVFPAGDDVEAKESQAKLGLMNFVAYPSYKTAGYNKAPVFLYESTYVPTDKPGFPNYGAFHTSEVSFALRTLHRWNRPWKKADHQMQSLMSGYWLRFVKTGDPNGEEAPRWEAFDKKKQQVMVFGKETRLVPGLYRQEFHLMETLDEGKQ